MTQDLKPLAKVTQALYSKKLGAMQKIRAEDNELRQAIAGLDRNLAEETRASQNDHALRSLGADLLWQSWVGRKKASLQMQLAQVLVREEHALKEMRLAFGKKDVMENLIRIQAERDKQEETRRSY